MKSVICFLIFNVCILLISNAQQEHGELELHHDTSGFRFVGVIGHTLVNNKELDKVFVPSWGVDIEYWFNNNWGVGLHNDIEIETFVIKDSKNDEIERVNPLVLTLDALYQIGNGFVITIGPGIELEKEKSYYLARLGFEYEKDINTSFYILPNLFLDQRFDGYNTLNIGLGIGLKI